MNEILDVSRIGARNYFNNALGSNWRQRMEKSWEMFVFGFTKKKTLKSLILREFKVLFNDSLTVVLFHRAVHYTVENSTVSGSKG